MRLKSAKDLEVYTKGYERVTISVPLVSDL